MKFPQEGLLSQFGQSFDDTLRPSLPTVAEPSWFAPPIDVRQEGGEMTLLFQVNGHPKDDLRVDANGRSIFIWGSRLRRRDHEGEGHRAMRVFALPLDFAPHELQTSRTGDVLLVRIVKKVDECRKTKRDRAGKGETKSLHVTFWNRGRERPVSGAPPPSEPDGRFSRIRLSSQWALCRD
jgi:HSP20 family molecular chaperone IbpA